MRVAMVVVMAVIVAMAMLVVMAVIVVVVLSDCWGWLTQRSGGKKEPGSYPPCRPKLP